MNEKINLKELTHLLAEKSSIQKKDAEAFLREYFDTIEEALFNDQLVKVKHLGSFKLTSVSDRESVDVQTKERVLIPAHYKVTYSPDNDLAQVVNEPFSLFEVVEINEDVETTESNPNDDNYEINKVNDEVNIVEEINVVEEEEKSEEIIEETQPQEEPIQTIKQPLPEKNEKKSTSNKIFIYCCVIVVLLGSGFYFYLNSEDMDVPVSDLSHNVVIESDNVLEDDTVEIIDEIIQDTIENVSQNLPVEKEKNIVSEKTPDPIPVIQNNELNTVSGKKRTIKSGERLTLIALEEYGDKNFWIYIYEENKSIIKNPNNVSSGLTITIPPANKYDIDKNNEESIKRAEELAKQYK